MLDITSSHCALHHPSHSSLVVGFRGRATNNGDRSHYSSTLIALANISVPPSLALLLLARADTLTEEMGGGGTEVRRGKIGWGEMGEMHFRSEKEVASAAVVAAES